MMILKNNNGKLNTSFKLKAVLFAVTDTYRISHLNSPAGLFTGEVCILNS